MQTSEDSYLKFPALGSITSLNSMKAIANTSKQTKIAILVFEYFDIVIVKSLPTYGDP